MDLLAYQRAFLRMSFAAEPEEGDLSAVGGREQALLYRHMIRTRLLGMAKVAFKAALEVVGEQAFAACFARYMAAAPPRSALIRDVIAEFGAFASGDLELLGKGPAYLVDLVCFETHKWLLAYLLPTPSADGALREFDFTGMPRWNSVFRCLSLAHAVHELERVDARERDEAAARVADACELFIYRPAGGEQVRWYKADPFFAALTRRSLATPGASLGALIPALAEERGVNVDQALLESLATSLTLAIERGVLLGVLDRS